MNNIIKTFLFLLFTKKSFSFFKSDVYTYIYTGKILGNIYDDEWKREKTKKEDKIKLEEFSINIDNKHFFSFTLNNYYGFDINYEKNNKLSYQHYLFKQK